MWKWLVLGCWIALQTMCMSHVTFTNLKCHSYNVKYSIFPTCQIKAVNRSHKYLNINVKLFKLPINDVWLKVKFMRFDNGYKPVFFDLSYDACKFLKDNNNPLARLFYNTFRNSSNMNHSCPYNHDILVDKLWTGNLEKGFATYVPIRNGDFAIFTEWITNKVPRSSVKIYFRISEK
ncbi:uncharacterized protein dls [Drosophila bipectinata]|uniref:uncharacterized protein dls n=1 Tax=Drosophila bipectinata TaxID=42026 RepID=UPI001C8933CB|nr:uncharacterized protein LOC122321777 [Drosophila bipectinata]